MMAAEEAKSEVNKLNVEQKKRYSIVNKEGAKVNMKGRNSSKELMHSHSRTIIEN